MELRYIKYTNFEPELLEVNYKLRFDMPTITCGYSKRNYIMLTGSYDALKYLKEIPADIEVVRVAVPDNVEAGIILVTPDMAKIDIHLPKNTVDSNSMIKAIKVSAIKALGLQKFNIISNNGNDLLIDINGKLRKFGGTFHCTSGSYDKFAINISFKIDYDLMNKLYRLDTEKMLKKGDISSMNDIVIGVDEFKEGIERSKFIDNFINNLKNRFNWDVTEGDFSADEKSRI